MKTTNKNNKMNLTKFLIVFMVAILPMTTFAQTSFDEFEDSDLVTSVVLNKKVFKMMAKIGGDTEEAKNYKELAESLTSLKMFATEDTGIASKMKSKVNNYLKSSNLSELMRVKDKDANVKIYIKEGKDEDHVRELFMFVDGINNVNIDGRKAEAVIVSITGDIDLNKISDLTKQLKIKGGEHLKKTKNNK